MGCAGSVPDDRRNRCPQSPGHSGGRAAAALNNHDMTNTTDSPHHRSTRVVEWIDAYNRYLGEGLLDMKPSTMSPSISSASTVTSSWNSNSRGGVVPQTTSRQQQQQHLRSERFGSSGQAVTNIGVIPTDTAPPPALRSSFTGLGGNRVPNHRGNNPTMMNNNNRNIIRNPLRTHEDAETSLIALEQEERYLSASPQLPPQKQQQHAGATPATTMASAALGMALLNAGQGGSIGSVPSIHIPSPVQLQYQQTPPPPRRQQPSSLRHHDGGEERGTYQNEDDDHNRDGELVRDDDDDDDECDDENNSPPSEQSQRPALVIDTTTLSSGQAAAAVVNSGGGGVLLDGGHVKTGALVPLHEDLSRHSPSSTPLVHVMHIGDGSTSSAVRHISGGESFPMQRGFTEGSPTRITSSKHAVE